MNAITKLFSLCAIGFVASACALDNDTPTPTPESPVIAVAPPAGTIIVPDPIGETPLLTVAFDGPPSQTVTKKSKATMLSIEFRSTERPIELKNVRVALEAFTPGCVLRSSTGYPYIFQLQLMDSSGKAFGWSKNLATVFPIAARNGDVGFFIPVSVSFPARSTFRMDVKAPFANGEDAPGEFYGCTYRATLQPFQLGDVRAANEYSSEDVPTSRIAPNTPVIGNGITVVEKGELSIVDDKHPASKDVVGGVDAFVHVASYKATAKYEEVGLDYVSLFIGTDEGLIAENGDVLEVMITGSPWGPSIVKVPGSGPFNVPLTYPLQTPKEGSITFHIWAKFAAHPGHAPAIGLTANRTDGEWGGSYDSYAGKLNVRCLGMTSGDHIYAPAGAKRGNVMYIK